MRQGFQFCIGDGSSSFWYDNWTGLGALCHLVDFVNISDTQLQLKDVSFIGSWDWNKLMTIVPNELSTTIDQSPPPLAFNDDIQDRWVRGASQIGRYSCSTSYSWLLSRYRELNDNESWDWIWKLAISTKVQHFMWLCMHNAIPTNKLRHHCNLATSPVCQRCGTYDEDVLHCLRDCAPSKEVWRLILSVNHPYFFSFTSCKTWLQTMSKGAFGNIFAITIWWIWGASGIIIFLATSNGKPKMSFIL